MTSALLLAGVSQTLSIAVVWFSARAFDTSMPLLALSWIVAVASLLQILPISFAGIGVREVSFVALLGLYGVPDYRAFSISLAVLGVNVIVGFAGWVLNLPPD